MELKKFIQTFAEQFEETDLALFTPETRFKDLVEWSSLMSLSIIAMVDESYNVKVKGEDIRQSKTIEDLYNLIKIRI